MKKSITDFLLKDKSVVIRCDLNVSLKANKIVDDTRIMASLKSIRYILDNGGKAIILSHLGKIKSEEDKDKYSLKVVYDRLKEFIPNLYFCDSMDFGKIKESVDNIPFGDAILLENTRFYDLDGNLESGCSDKLSLFYASLGDIFINDAFGTMHRAHASNVGISKYLDSGIGFLVEKELDNLEIVLNPKDPFVVIMGGAKISDKLKVINSIIDKVQYLLVGGAMANTFLAAQGLDVGKSLYEEDMVLYCKSLLTKYNDKIILPVDFYGTDELKDKKGEYFTLDSFNTNLMQLDIGSNTVELFVKKLKDAKTIFWNGPLGYADFSNYSYGTEEVLKHIDKKKSNIVLGGGDVVGACKNLGLEDNVTFLSTGGGATLEYIANGSLVGLDVIGDK